MTQTNLEDLLIYSLGGTGDNSLSQQDIDTEFQERDILAKLLDTPLITHRGIYSILDEYDHDDNTPTSLGIDINNLDIKQFNDVLKTANQRKNKHNSTIDEILVTGLVKYIRESNDFPESYESEILDNTERMTDFRKSSAMLRDAVRKSGPRTIRVIEESDTHAMLPEDLYF